MSDEKVNIESRTLLNVLGKYHNEAGHAALVLDKDNKIVDISDHAMAVLYFDKKEDIIGHVFSEVFDVDERIHNETVSVLNLLERLNDFGGFDSENLEHFYTTLSERYDSACELIDFPRNIRGETLETIMYRSKGGVKEPIVCNGFAKRLGDNYAAGLIYIPITGSWKPAILGGEKKTS